ncbi:aspartate aminotransferase family protein [Pseudobacteriovorax antillogorgiicola]|uniref:4-aminobutyrate aminotransferase / (S)-3-amino-2-methylpropionate transaminase n=1 Tax=Pseudobacteriovorax antillogorgiicola TaxID=1513793 RepID=A0A1Y6B3Y1_9BACT|nr:aspartate aminotransferase family protein [Pseudobacteriovorax antillogorgiicola]TCS59217.1 4-aminobutyrate aminotransferase/(S)-3-amino-2-methylpropionate transaminase [Pseudobacteriovorax antillogorgiicola]SME90422.1 4-aminobutyrate aminotransferase / (S)-3-amino-2-methylpropionate transaminase [Pseudobacteriovorax antillogorgiicola]
MKNESWLAKLDQTECPDSTYTKAKPPLVFSSAEGSQIWDVEGQAYIDLCAGFGVMALGHNSPEIQELFRAQLESPRAPMVHGMGDVYPSEAKIMFIQELLALMPVHLKRAALSLTGSQAVEIALKTCLLYKPQGDFICFQGSYHGLDLGVLPLTSRRDFKDPFGSWLPQGRVVELPYHCERHEIEKAIAGMPHGLAGIFVEPIQGRAGIRPSDPSWLPMLRDVCDQEDGLLVFDEVFTGMGRIGTLTSSFEVHADLICLGKALGGGFPLSACIGTEEAFQRWPQSSGEAIHTGTFFGHPLSCRMGVSVLRRMSEDRLWERSKSLGKEAVDYLSSQLANQEAVKAVRGTGLMLGIEFEKAGEGAALMNELRAKGVIALASGEHGESLSMTPALTIKKDLLWEAFDRIIAHIQDR